MTFCSPLPCALGTMIKKSYHGSRRLSPSIGSRTLNTSSLGLGSWGDLKLKTRLHAPPGCDFIFPACGLQAYAPTLSRVRSSQQWQSWESNPLPALPVIRVLFRCNIFDVSSVFWLCFKSTSSSSSSIILIDPV